MDGIGRILESAVGLFLTLALGALFYWPVTLTILALIVAAAVFEAKRGEGETKRLWWVLLPLAGAGFNFACMLAFAGQRGLLWTLDLGLAISLVLGAAAVWRNPGRRLTASACLLGVGVTCWAVHLVCGFLWR
ncbi:MAG: hypothetical protein MH204_02300 [Fimbriimonadaceae bacterium]|nr:hypothetical protein [Fimbriimonadaceae bacterium]